MLYPINANAHTHFISQYFILDYWETCRHLAHKMRGFLRLLLLPAATLGVAVKNELCPDGRAETKICSANQDFVLVLDRSFSRRDTFVEFKDFLRKFIENIGLDGTNDGGTNDGPRVSLVSFAGRSQEGITGADGELNWNNADGHKLDTSFTDLSGSKVKVLDWIDNLEEPAASCSGSDGCTCISCGAEVAWGLIPEADRRGAAAPLPVGPCPPPLHALAMPLAAPASAPSLSTFRAPSAGRAGGGQPPTLIFLTDGEQNPWYAGVEGAGPDEVLSTTNRIKAEGARLVMVGYGVREDGVTPDYNSDQLDKMASEPSSTCAGGLGSGLGSGSGSGSAR